MRVKANGLLIGEIERYHEGITLSEVMDILGYRERITADDDMVYIEVATGDKIYADDIKINC